VGSDIDTNVAEIERAAFQLRRLWTKPQLLRHLRERCEQGDGIQLSNLMVIYAVADLGEDHDDVTVGAVADRLDVDPSTGSRLVGHAIDAGFVSRRPSRVDARRANLDLTDAGRTLKELADGFRYRFIAELVADWTDAERAEFARLLRRFSDAAARFPPATGPAAPAARLFEPPRPRDAPGRTPPAE
jgi:DNA-binding MarR family transcriptional regulator